jgi:hypothetical protein
MRLLFIVDRLRSIGKRICIEADDTDEEDVDPDVIVDIDPEVIEREAKIIRAAKHVAMARCQQKLFQEEMRQARADTLANDTSDVVLHKSQRSYVFVGDYVLPEARAA